MRSAPNRPPPFVPVAAPKNFHVVDLHPPSADFAADIAEWLSGRRNNPPAKYLYDAKGAKLFDKITETPEYYLTRTEMPLLDTAGRDIAAFLGDGLQIVEFGSGSNEKLRRLIAAIGDAESYVAIDISRDHLIVNSLDLAEDFPSLQVTAICADFGQPIDLPRSVKQSDAPRLGFFPGSTLGNLNNEEASSFLRRAGQILGSSQYFLVGVDLVKDPAILEAAYDDAAGYSAAFSRNLADRIHRELKVDLSSNDVTYSAHYNQNAQQIEMLWTMRERRCFSLAGQKIVLSPNQRLVAEISRKFTLDRIDQLASAAGFTKMRAWTDPNHWFALVLLRNQG